MVVKMEIHQHHHSPTNSELFQAAARADRIGAAISSSDWVPPFANERGNSVCSFPASADSAELLVPGRVAASATIPQGAMTIQIQPWSLTGAIDVQQISVGLTPFGTLDLDKKSKEIWTQDRHWARAIRLSDDCHTYNVQLKFQPSYRMYANTKGGPQPKLILQAVRSIEAGQELQLWFSEDILAMLQVVFLNPSNIQGQKKYICNRCSTLYESPNPLKLHMTLGCGKLAVSTLWERLASMIEDTQTLRNVAHKVHNFEFKLSPETQVCRQKNALDLTVGPPSTTISLVNKGLYRPYTECSAFRPFRKSDMQLSASPRMVHEGPPTLWPISFETDVVQLHRNLMNNQALNAHTVYSDDAQIESLVSSLGKAKQGHICLYCGKCYSRKYGLKIHIRTHTGYKPLRCKFCERPFGDPSNLNKHVRLHAEGNTPYKCDLCGKILVRRRDLERHLKSRHMVEMHPGQNILPDSPASINENSNSFTESTQTNLEIEDHKPVSPNENINSLNEKPSPEILKLMDEEDVKIIDIHKEDILDSNDSSDDVEIG